MRRASGSVVEARACRLSPSCASRVRPAPGAAAPGAGLPDAPQALAGRPPPGRPLARRGPGLRLRLLLLLLLGLLQAAEPGLLAAEGARAGAGADAQAVLGRLLQAGQALADQGAGPFSTGGRSRAGGVADAEVGQGVA